MGDLKIQLNEDIGSESSRWLDQWPDGLIGLDDTGHIRFVSREFEVLLGWMGANIVGTHVHDLLCIKTRDFFHDLRDCPLCRPALNPSDVVSSFWLKADGVTSSVDFRLIPFSDVSHVTRIISFQNNQHKTHSSEEAAHLLAYVENNPSPIGEFDINAQILFGNSAFNEALLTYGFNDQGQSRMLPYNVLQICYDVVQHQRVHSGVEVEVDGRWLSWHFAPLNSRGAASLVAYAFEISEQKRLQLQDAQDKARARRDFYAKMVHELRTPLNAIIGFSQVLLRRLANSIEERELANLKAIKTAGLQLNQMISNTLELSKIDAGKMEVEESRFSVGEMFESVSEQLESLANAKGLSYSIDCYDELYMTSDVNKVRQIIVNLLSNAIKYTHQGSVSTSVKNADGDCLEFVIRDTGMGISQENLAKLFDVYGRIGGQNTQNIQGTGLGLALVAEFVEMLHGKITLESQLEIGTTFTVLLPINHVREV